MPSTREQRIKRAALEFKYVIEELFCQDMDGPIARALLNCNNGAYDIRVIEDFNEEYISNLHYFVDVKDEKGKATPTKVDLVLGDKAIIRRLINFKAYKDSIGESMDDNWSTVTGDEFDRYRRTTNNIRISTPAPSRLLPKGTIYNTSNATAKETQAEQFKK